MNTQDFDKYYIWNDKTNENYLSDKNLRNNESKGINNFGKLREFLWYNIIWDSGCFSDEKSIFTCFDPCSSNYDRYMNGELVTKLTNLVVEETTKTEKIILGKELSSLAYSIIHKYAEKFMIEIMMNRLQSMQA